MGLHDNGQKEYRRIHNEIMCKVYVIICNIFHRVFRLEDCMKILKRLNVTQLVSFSGRFTKNQPN